MKMLPVIQALKSQKEYKSVTLGYTDECNYLLFFSMFEKHERKDHFYFLHNYSFALNNFRNKISM